MCLFNCQLGDDELQQLLTSFQDGEFAQLRELDLSGNNIQEIQMQKLLDVLQEPRTASALKVQHSIMNVSQLNSLPGMIEVLHATRAEMTEYLRGRPVADQRPFSTKVLLCNNRNY